MNDPSAPFVAPQPETSWLRRQARGWRRDYARFRRDSADSGLERKRWNVELNWREFWHGRTRLESTPRLIQVGTNWTCNLKCNFCRLTMEWTQEELRKLTPAQREISPRVYETVKRLLPGAEMMVLTPLGEPFLWSRLDDLLDHHAALQSHNLALTTNGMLLNDKNCERVVRGGLAHMFVSIDSNDAEIYAGMRVGGNLERIEEGLRRLADWKRRLESPYPKLTCNATFLRRNLPQATSMVDWAKGLGFEELSIQLMEIENPELEEEFLGHCPELVHDHVVAALARGREIGMSVRPHLAIRNLVTAARAGRDVRRHEYAAAAPNMPSERKQTSRPSGNGAYGGLADEIVAEGGNGGGGCATCAASAVDGEAARLESALDMTGKTLVEKCHYPWYNLLIDTDGDARPCCWADLSWGNLNDLEFEQIWNGPRAVGMRQAFLANRIPVSCRRKHCRVDL
jgi:MoaA/NifB/PqqE/SkfB family radical SAM enzyme